MFERPLDNLDPRLQEQLDNWERHLEVVDFCERKFFFLEATKKPLNGMLFIKESGKNISEREAKVNSSDEWKVFEEGYWAARNEYNSSLRKKELLMKSFDAAYLQFKREADYLNRGK